MIANVLNRVHSENFKKTCLKKQKKRYVLQQYLTYQARNAERFRNLSDVILFVFYVTSPFSFFPVPNAHLNFST